MVIDTSAILAVLLDESERPTFARLIQQDPKRLVSVVTRVEAAIVIENRKGEAGLGALERFLAVTALETIAVTAEHGAIAAAAYSRFGKGRHPAALNLGDVFAYALAKATGEPLLFKGEDFARTDIVAAA